jgi:hypothetical protein
MLLFNFPVKVQFLPPTFGLKTLVVAGTHNPKIQPQHATAEACYKVFTPTAASDNFDKNIVFYISHSYREIQNKFSIRVYAGVLVCFLLSPSLANHAGEYWFGSMVRLLR